MSEYLNKFAVPIFWAIMAYLRPIGDELTVLCMIFMINFFCGLVTDIVVNNSTFKFRKAWSCVTELVTFLFLVVLVYQYGKLKNWNVGAMQIVSFITYTVTYFYVVNALRNLKTLFRKHTTAYKVFDFLHLVLSLECMKLIPHLSDYLNEKKNDEDNSEETRTEE